MVETGGNVAPQTSEAQVMQGDVVRSRSRATEQLGWVCCITPESDEGHVYWQPHKGAPAADSREPLKSLLCADRALIPGDIVRRCDIGGGEGQDRGGRDRDAMGMVVSTEVMLDLLMLPADSEEEATAKINRQTDPVVRRMVPASSLRHLVPIRLVTWVVHRTDGWLGRVQSWDEDLILNFTNSSGSGSSRCRVPAANLKQGLGIVESFYRDFFPGLSVTVSLQDFRSGVLECEWLIGDASSVVARGEASDGNLPQKKEAVIEEVSVGSARVEWLSQVPLRKGTSTEQPPRTDGCLEDKLLFLLGEAECSSRWALGDRLRFEGGLAEVCSVETFVDVRWQDDALSVRVPARELQLCNPDAFSFFPSELICQRQLDENLTGGGGPFRSGSPLAASTPVSLSRAGGGPGGQESGGSPDDGGRSRKDAQSQPRVGFVVRADPASRMVNVRWLEEKGTSDEEEWSAFDLQIDPEYGYRLGDAVIRCRDWEEGMVGSARDTPESDESIGPRVGQVAALEAGSVRVRWLDGSVSLHAPRELYRVGDEEEGSMAESQQGEAPADPSAVDAPEGVAAPPAEPPQQQQLEGVTPKSTAGETSCAANAPAPQAVVDTGSVPPAAAPEGAANATAGAADNSASDATANAAQAASSAVEGGAASPEGSPAPRDEEGQADNAGQVVNEISFEDMAWEPLPPDHHFLHSPAHPPGPSNRFFMRRVQREWQILQRGLPRNLWVHVYPDRMELLRSCLIGPEGTPYANALFFFDLHLPSTYPQIPPQVRFWSFGENLNPNLYENGKVCLSLLGTWSGKDSETWSPERSNLLQVLVSILGLVLNTEPYYNEPGFERERDTPQGDLRSQRYNESVALSSYHLMLRVLRTPPVDFDRIAKQHFAERREAILNHARHLQSGGDSNCSEGFKKSLTALIPRLEEALPKEPPP